MLIDQESNPSHRKRGKHRTACEPCNQRKVRCDRELVQPCSNCVRRQEPELCGLGSGLDSRAQPHHASARASSMSSRSSSRDRRQPEQSHTSPPAGRDGDQHVPVTPTDSSSATSNHQARSSRPGDPSPPSSHIGEPSMAMFIRHQASNKGYNINDDISSLLGLSNGNAGYPFLFLGSLDDRWKGLALILPHPFEIHRCLPFFRDGAAIIAPMFPDYSLFDAQVCAYLEDYASNKLREKAVGSDDVHAREFFAEIGLILAALAAGSQCSSDDFLQRQAATKSFVFRAFHCLRMSNFLLKPTLTVIQTYLLIVIVLQNESEADGAWALIGTVMRLAQSIGLHLGQFRGDETQARPGIRERTWFVHNFYTHFPANLERQALVSQDCLLSLCYGRPVSIIESSRRSVEVDLDLVTLKADYLEYLWLLSNLAHQFLGPRSAPIDNQDQLKSRIDRIQNLQSLFQPSSSENVRTTKQRLEHYGFKLYSSFVISLLCQQRLRDMGSHGLQGMEQTEWSRRLVCALIDTVTSFLSMQTISALPLRIWSIQHMALCSAFLLSFRTDLKQQHALLRPVEALIDAFSGADNEVQVHSMGALAPPYGRALLILRERCGKGSSADVAQPSNEANPGVDEMASQNIPSNSNFEQSMGTSLDSLQMETARLDSFWDEQFFTYFLQEQNSLPTSF